MRLGPESGERGRGGKSSAREAGREVGAEQPNRGPPSLPVRCAVCSPRGLQEGTSWHWLPGGLTGQLPA